MLSEINVREFVQRGIKKPLKFYINERECIKFRALGDLEIHEAYNKPVNKIQDNYTLQAFLSARNNGEVNLELLDVELIDLQLLLDCMDEIKSWLIYLATKDFQPRQEDYSIEDVKKLEGVFVFATLILDVSGNTDHAEEIIKIFTKTKEGKALRFYLRENNSSLTSSYQDLTRNQMNFLYYTSEGYRRKKIQDLKDSVLDGSVINFKDPDLALKQFRALSECLQEEPPAFLRSGSR